MKRYKGISILNFFYFYSRNTMPKLTNSNLSYNRPGTKMEFSFLKTIMKSRSKLKSGQTRKSMKKAYYSKLWRKSYKSSR